MTQNSTARIPISEQSATPPALTEMPSGQHATRTTHHAILVAALILGAALRLIGLARQSLWTDELYVVWEARQPLSTIFDSHIHVQHPPGYRLALHFWM